MPMKSFGMRTYLRFQIPDKYLKALTKSIKAELTDAEKTILNDHHDIIIGRLCFLSSYDFHKIVRFLQQALPSTK